MHACGGQTEEKIIGHVTIVAVFVRKNIKSASGAEFSIL
jgi:hypothetical protein